MSTALLLEYYQELPELPNEDARAWQGKARIALEKFKRKVQQRYNEGTLHRLLSSADSPTRQAAIVALGLTGTMARSNIVLATVLRDDDAQLRLLAEVALWRLWFHAASDREARELSRLIHVRDIRKKRSGLDALIERTPDFAEAYNQRAIVHFQLEEWHKSIADCERAIKLNPLHFGAAAGMGRCFMELGKNKAALKAFRVSYRINPGMQEVEAAIRALENALGEEGRRDDKK